MLCPMVSLPLRLLHAVMAALFVFAATLQYNDTDALAWIIMYLAAAAPCVLVVLNRARWILAAGVALIALAWAAVYLSQGAWKVPPSAMFSEWTMSDDHVRAARELYGLGLIGLFLVFSAMTTRRTKT